MATWMEGTKMSLGRTCVDRRDADGLEAWLGKFGDQDAMLKAMNEKDEDGRTMLHWAVTSGDHRIVQILLDRGAAIEGADDEGTTVLHSACARGDTRTVKMLLDALASRSGETAVRSYVRESTNSGVTALHYAAGRGNDAIIHMLVDVGSKLNPADKYGNTPLFRAVSKNHNQAAIALVQLGADPERQNAVGDTVMHLACENGSDHLVRYFVEEVGPEFLQVENEDKKTPLDVVDAKYKPVLATFLAGSG